MVNVSLAVLHSSQDRLAKKVTINYIAMLKSSILNSNCQTGRRLINVALNTTYYNSLADRAYEMMGKLHTNSSERVVKCTRYGQIAHDVNYEYRHYN